MPNLVYFDKYFSTEKQEGSHSQTLEFTENLAESLTRDRLLICPDPSTSLKMTLPVKGLSLAKND